MINSVKVERFIENYNQVVQKFDVEAIAKFFYKQFVLSTPDYILQLNNDAEFRINLAKAFEEYIKLGTKRCCMKNKTFTHVADTYSLVSIEWSLMDANSHELICFDISYIIKSINNELFFVFVADHNEEERLAFLKSHS